jgi:tetratricopeptide (TPR) repeat protein
MSMRNSTSTFAKPCFFTGVHFIYWLSFSATATAQIKISDFKTIDENIHLLWYDQYANKSIVGEFQDFLVLIEFPQNDTLSNEVIDFLKAKFPKKEIRYVTHSHHHGHSISAFDPFLKKTKANLLTTAYNYDHIKSITQDTLSLSKRVVLFTNVHEIKDKLNHLQINMVPQTAYAVPTREYNVFYFKPQQVLVSGCLFNKPKSYFEVVNARKFALKKFISDHQIDAQTFVPTNTSRANGFEDICSLALYDSALVNGIIPQVFCDEFQTFRIDYLAQKADSLKNEFKKIPRSFDYQVIGSTLKIIRKDYFRALIVFRVLTEIYPTEPESYFYLAECYEGLAFKPEALAYYQKFLGLSKDQDDIAEVQKKIKQLQ